MGKFDEEEEPNKIKKHLDFEYNRLHAEKVFMQTKPMFEKLVPNQKEPVIQPIKIKLNENDVTVSLQAMGKPVGNYAYAVAYSQSNYEFKQELKNVLIATWELYHERFKRFYEV